MSETDFEATVSHRPHSPLAIVGIGCRFPGAANDAESFWKLLVEGRSGIIEVPADRWDLGRHYHPDPAVPGMAISKWGGFVEHLAQFDARFWGLSPREAMRMDPQQRWLLEVAWEAIEDSGTAPRSLRGTDVGVFVGIASNDYGSHQMQYHEEVDAYTNSGSAASIASNRISYLLDLRGPSTSVDTACSSGLVAVWLACRSIWSGCCATALAGGVNALITPHASIGFSRASMLSPSGQCLAFDARANGYVRAEGAGVVYLKTLDQALADRDRIYAVIRAAVVNQDGHTSSMTVPGLDGQSAMLRQAYREAGITPGRVAYVEAHGTGTPVGDPIEAAAIGLVLREGRAPGTRCLIGSVKTNIGHLEAGSGLPGLIKAALILHHDVVPPSANFETPNPHIPFDALALEVASRLQTLPHVNGLPPIVGVNSFGFGGTNAHVVLEAPPSVAVPIPAPSAHADRPCVLPISARDDVALRHYVESYQDLLAGSGLNLADLCHAAGARKEHHDHRVLAFGRDADQVRGSLTAWLNGTASAGQVVSGRAARVRAPLVLVFTGQGPQWWAMGRQLLEREPVFRRTVQEIDALFQPLAGCSLIAEMTRAEGESRLDRTDVAQPAIFALQAGLAALWASWGIHPTEVIGHSVGEVAAALCAGIYTLDDAVRIIFHRSRLQATTGGHGRMLAAGITGRDARVLIGADAARVQIAVMNSPTMTTLAGDTAPLEDMAKRLEHAGTFHRWLRINYAFHTHQMEAIRDALIASLAGIRPRPSRVPFISTVTGGLLDGEQLDHHYWWRNVRQPVLFGPAIANLLRQGERTFVELGPHPALASAIGEHVAASGRSGGVFHSLQRHADESVEMLTNLAGLALRGEPVDWRAVNQSDGAFTALPRYPWNRESFWLESTRAARERLAPEDHPLLGLRTSAAQPTWQCALHPGKQPYLNDHRLWDGIVFPGSGYGEIGLAVAGVMAPGEPHAVEDLDIKKALFIDVAHPPTLQVVFDPDKKAFSVFSSVAETDVWDLHAEGRITRAVHAEAACVDLAQLREALPNRVDHDRYYAGLAAAGYQFGPDFQMLEHVWHTAGEALAEIVVPPSIAGTADRYHVHPAVLDACFQIFKGLQPASPGADPADDFYLPQAIRRIRLACDVPPTRLWAHARLVSHDAHSLVADILVYDENGRRVADILGFRVDRVERRRTADDVDQCFYQLAWRPSLLAGQGAAGDADPDGVAIDHAGLMAVAPVPVTSASVVRTVQPVGGYVVLADESGTGDRLIAELRKRGRDAVAVRASTAFQQTGDREVTVAVDSADDLCRALGAAADAMGGVHALVHCWSLDHPASAPLDADQLIAAQRTGVLSALCLLHTEAALPPRAWFVTRNVHRVEDADRADGLASSPLVGVIRVANNELPHCRLSMIDVDDAPAGDVARDLCDEVTADDGESETAYRAGRRSVLRLRRVVPGDLPMRRRNAAGPHGALVPYRLETSQPGVLTNLALHETPRVDPGPGAIEIRVRAGGINFRDVMKALGTYPGHPIDERWFGDDVAGVVERVGPGVRHLRVGDEVAGMAPYAFRAFATVEARMVFRKPSRISFEQAATVPTVFLTAHYALRHLARMRAGESILIHAGTGGVGQAAIQIATRLGLEIFATAGTEDKRRLLRELGVHHAMDSRTLEFAEQIRAITGGRGVDAVLNSLAGDFIPASMAVLAPFGRFLEIGKIDIYKNATIGLGPLRHNISYFVLDLAQHLHQRPDEMAPLFETVGERLASGEYQPLTHTVFPVTQVVEAFRYMAQGRHVGKNVLSFDAGDVSIGPCTDDAHRFRSDATYLITGGAGGFGLEVAKWMSHRGARHLVLVSRSGPREAASREIDHMRAAGMTVVDARADVTSRDDVTRVIRQIHDNLPPLKGVIHGAMVLDDDLLSALDVARFRKAMDPKMMGAWHLHVATQDIDLDHFIGFSSFSAAIGAPRQGNYNAGNAFLEALAAYRRARGLPAETIAWGALRGAGVVERSQKTAQYLNTVGLKAFDVPEALRIFGRLIDLDPVTVSASRTDWRTLSKIGASIVRNKTYAGLALEGHSPGAGGSIAADLKAAAPDARALIVETFLAAQLAAVFGTDESRISRDAPLTSLGLDSLMAIELMNRIERDLGTGLPMASLLSGPSIEGLARIVLRTLEPRLVAGADGAAAVSARAGGVPLSKADGPREEFPLSESQQAIWRRARQAHEGATCHRVFAARCDASLDVNALRLAFAALIDRHPMLNVVFRETNGLVVQQQRSHARVDFVARDVSDAVSITDAVRQEAGETFDLGDGPLTRMRVVRGSPNGLLVLLVVHQLIADSRSMSVLVQDLFEVYSGIVAGQSPASPPQPYAFPDFVAWERAQLEGAAGAGHREFWRHELEGAPRHSALPIGVPRPAGAARSVAVRRFTLDDPDTHAALALSAEQGVPLFSTLLSAFAILLHREYGQADVLVGASLAGRPHPELQRLVGCFADATVIRSRIHDDPTCAEMLQRINLRVAAVRDHQPLTMQRLPEQLLWSSEAGGPPLVQAGFLMERRAADDPHGVAAGLTGCGGHRFHRGDLAIETVDAPVPLTPCEIGLAVEEAGGRMYGCWSWNRDACAADTIERLHAGWTAALAQIARDPLQRVSQIAFEGRPSATGAREPAPAGPAPVVWRGQNADSGDVAIDYGRDAELDADIAPADRVVCDAGKMDRVLLTGATGFLGSFLLNDLLRHTRATVYCLVRARDDRGALQRIRASLSRYRLSPPGLSDRVVPVPGDLARTRLGLSPDVYQRLAVEVDAIYHNGAMVNLVYPYPMLRDTNVGGTHEILRLAAREHLKPTHYVSTFWVQAADRRRARDVVREGDPLPACDALPIGYAQSKWVCEKLIEQARGRGVPVTIYRPGYVTGDSRTGACKLDDFVHTVVLACTRIGAVPTLDMTLEVTPVDFVSRAIVYLSQQSARLGNTYHLVNPHPLTMAALAAWMPRAGFDVRAVPYGEWRAALEELVQRTPGDPIGPLMSVLGRGDGQDPGWHPRYDCTRATSDLVGSGIVCPAADDALLATYQTFLRHAGAFTASQRV